MNYTDEIFDKIQTETVTDAVVSQFERLILTGVLKSGQKIPSERKLAELTGVSRPMVREALKELEDRGLLESTSNGGAVVSTLTGMALAPALVDLFARNSIAFVHYLEFRLEVEGYAAFLAADRATDSDREIIARIVAEMNKAHERQDHEREAILDVNFHSAIMDATHNAMLIHMMAAIYDLMRRGIFYNRQFLYNRPAGLDAMLEQHHAIADAILARQPEAACDAAEAHMEYVRKAFAVERDDTERKRIARKRLKLFEQDTMRDRKPSRRSRKR